MQAGGEALRGEGLLWSVARTMKGFEIVEGQGYFTGSTAELQKLLTEGKLDRCGSLVVEGKLTTVPPEIGRLTRLQELVLDTDTVQSIDAGIFGCAGLGRLVVLSNQLKELPSGGWARLGALEHLVLTGARALRGLPEDIGAATKIGGEFDLTPLTKLGPLPRSFGTLARVTLLRLPPGVVAPDPIAGMTGLRELELRAVDRLPEGLGALKDLRLIEASECPIAAVPASIGGASALRSLGLGRTLVTALPDSVCELMALQELDLQETPLAALPEGIGRVPLTRLRLQRTRITRLPESLATPAGDLRIFLPRDQRAAIEASSAGVLAALGKRAVFE